MVVDDQEPFRDAARATVARIAGFELVAEATSGEEALSIFAAAAPDLVLMDINLGGMNGIETTRLLTETDPGTVVLLLSTYDERDLPATVGSCGAIGYLHKDELSARRLREVWAAL